MLSKIKESADFIKSKFDNSPVVGIVLGTGLGDLVDYIEDSESIDYSQIPNFPLSTVKGHKGKLIFGKISGVNVVAMQGRFHFYEGYSIQEVVFPIRVLKFLGIEYLFVSNASGGVNPEFEVGDIMVIKDHINLIPNPLIGKNYEELGPRFPDMSEAYSKSIINMALDYSTQNNLNLQSGVYVSLTGPTLETLAEYGYIRAIGGDAVGMSTAPEVIVANHMGLKCFGVSVITDLGVPGKIKKVTHEEIMEVAELNKQKLSNIFCHIISQITT